MGKTGLQDLPPEIVRHIIDEVERKHSLLLVCKVCLFYLYQRSKCLLIMYVKQTSLIASEYLYASLISGEEERHSIDGYTPPLSKLIEGLQHTEPTRDAPFGSDVKLSFLKRAKKMQHAFGTYICFRESSS